MCVYMSPGDRGCKMNNWRQEKLFLSHRDWHREHIVPSNDLFLGLDSLCDDYFESFTKSLYFFFFFFLSYFLNLAANTYSFMMLILIIAPLSFLDREIKSFPNSYKSSCI